MCRSTTIKEYRGLISTRKGKGWAKRLGKRDNIEGLTLKGILYYYFLKSMVRIIVLS
jgi:hypothetical protein